MGKQQPIGRRLTGSILFFWWVSLLPAQAPPCGEIPAALWDASQPTTGSSWFGPVQVSSAVGMTVWRASIRPPPGNARLAVTLLFEETQGGFARLIWQGSNRALTLCNNLYEGAAPLHLRTLLLDRETLAGPGQLVLEATGERPVLLRAELSWVEPLVLAANGRTPPGLYLAASGKIFPADELQGTGRRTPQDDRRGRIVDAVLDPGPVSIPPQTPVRFLVSIPASPAYARLEAQVAGLGPGEEPFLSVNGKPLPSVALELPGLDDVGYRWMAGAGDLAFGGWRSVAAFVPVGFLRAGENQVEWQGPSVSRGSTLRHFRLQVSYDSAPPVSALVHPPEAFSPSSVSPSFSADSGRFGQAPRLRLGLSSGTGGVGLRSE